MASEFKVRLSCDDKEVVFEASAPVSESRSANYESFNIIHLPTDIYSYRNTSGRKLSISGKLVSRTPEEASQNAYYLDLIRSWLLPDFGESGATPPILKLNAYNNKNLKDVQVILTSYSFTFPDDVDYIWENASSPMPVIGSLQIDLAEVFSPQQVTQKAWKLGLSAPGSFMLGADLTIGGGNAIMTTTPSMIDITRQRNFSGIAPSVPSTNTVGGVTNGISGMIGAVSGAISDVTGSIMNTVKSVIGVNSPGSSPDNGFARNNVVTNSKDDTFYI